MTNKSNNTPSIHISKGNHHGQTVIICSFDRDYDILKSLKTIPTLRYSKTLGSWYLPYTKEDWAAFIALKIPHQIENFGTTGRTRPISDSTDTNLAVMPPDCTKQAADNIVSIRYHHPFFIYVG